MCDVVSVRLCTVNMGTSHKILCNGNESRQNIDYETTYTTHIIQIIQISKIYLGRVRGWVGSHHNKL